MTKQKSSSIANTAILFTINSLNMKTTYFQILVLLSLVFFTTSCKDTKVVQAEELIPIVKKALLDTNSIYYANFALYPTEKQMLSIGVFDSGTGGLTVLEKMLSLDKFDNITGKPGGDKILDFAGEHFIYLADQANMPYGNYDAVGKSDYLKELAVKDALFLMGNKYYANQFEENPTGEKPRVKILVIACNTATAYGLKDIQTLLGKSNTGVKVIGVINAGVKATFEELQKNGIDSPFAIGVLATPGTISSRAYMRTINEYIRDHKIKIPIMVINQKGYGFAEAVDRESDFISSEANSPRSNYRGPRIGKGDDSLDISLMKIYNFDFKDNNMLYTMENGNYTKLQLNSAANYARFNLVSLIEKHRLSGSNVPLKAVILGCTHYPFLINTLNDVINEMRNIKVNGKNIYKSIIADDFIFIDPAIYTAIECYNVLRADSNLALRITEQELNAYISVPNNLLKSTNLTPDGKLTYNFKYGRNVGTEEITTKQVPFSKSNIDAENLTRIENLLPYTYSLIYPTLY